MDVNRPFFHPCFGHISPLLAQLPLTTAPQMPNCRLSAFLVPGLVPGLCAALLAFLVSGCSTTEIDRIPQELGRGGRERLQPVPREPVQNSGLVVIIHR